MCFAIGSSQRTDAQYHHRNGFPLIDDFMALTPIRVSSVKARMKKIRGTEERDKKTMRTYRVLASFSLTLEWYFQARLHFLYNYKAVNLNSSPSRQNWWSPRPREKVRWQGNTVPLPSQTAFRDCDSLGHAILRRRVSRRIDSNLRCRIWRWKRRLSKFAANSRYCHNLAINIPHKIK